MNRKDYTEGESERQLRKWGFELRGGEPHVSHDIWDHWDDGRSIIVYDDGRWYLIIRGRLADATPNRRTGRGTASLMTYLRTAGE
jgi:hypothetical protein